ncbi:LamG domain-containing protein [Streptomyces sp. GMY01]|uniref:LamG-like jellyroll fold domain-containing protein n=1 Tax=Streptomyces sp. GMY02 TaxID=1333528 RepID=UPI00146D1FAC|nr:LamG domain-containing protein [Streptomyces sp. GMY02]NMO33555.1 LamG domain-containing protein [Streptomyces sp. GMY02]
MAVLPSTVAHAAGSEADPVPLSEGQQALAQAQESGERVEVTGERTERATVYANPDGSTFTLEESAVPVRAEKPGGGWQAPDATLVKLADGSVGPRAATVDMAFSGGGDTALARIAEQGMSLELSWPGKLPAPQIEGTSALYADVLPGVDLRVTATPESFQPVFVVKTPEAAAGDDLKKLTFGLKSEGLRVREGAAGNLTASDADGRTVFKAPPARMWDSAGAAGAGARPAVKKLATTQATAPADPAETAPSRSGLEPGQGDTVARMDVDVTADSLSVVPDADLLTKADASAFPLFIDPTITWGESERTLLRSDGYESYGWSNGDDDQGKGAGKCGTWSGYYCGPGYVQKLYFEFSPSDLKGKAVLDATFRVTEPWAFQCDPRWVDLVRTNNISSSTTWSSRPKELDLMGDRSVSAGRGSLCDPNSPKAPIEFNDNPEESNENLTPTVKDFAAGKFSRLTLEIRAHDESDTSAWKRFRNDAVLAVDFVGLPGKPTAVGLASGGTSTTPVCEKSQSDPAIVSDPAPTLKATAQTQAGGEKDAQLRISFDLDVLNTNGSWSDATAGNGSLRPSTGFIGDNSAVALKWSTLTDNKLYRYRASTWSYYNGGARSLSSAPSDGYCYFRIDSTAPKAPTISVKAPYTECTTNACLPGGGPGLTAAFTFQHNAADTNVKSFQYKLSTTSTWSSTTGTTASVVPQRSGTYTLQVRGKDDVGTGRLGDIAQIDFVVAAGAGPVGRWHFDEPSGEALDSGTATGSTRHPAVLTGGAVRDDRGRRGVLTHDAQGAPLPEAVTDKGMNLNGTTAYAATTAAVVDTRASYTMSAWVRLNTAGSLNQTILGQDGTLYSGFYLSYQGSYKTWTLRTSPKDAPDGNISEQIVVAKQPAVAGVWTHLAAVYDAPNKQIRLYVNGVLQGTDTVTSSWAAGGPLQIGRVMWRGTYYDYLSGSIDEVAAWQQALTDTEIADEAKLLTSDTYAGTELVAHWSADQAGGSTVADTDSGYGRALTLADGAGLDGESIVLDGVDDAATAEGPVVDDTGSFTVTTLASLDEEALLSKDVGYKAQVLGQRTADGSSWGLWYELTDKTPVLDEDTMEETTVPVGYWRFGRLNTDGSFTTVSSDEAALAGGMVRLTGVFDAQAGTISLYTGTEPNGDALAYTAKAGSGEFAVGKGFTGGAWTHYLPGRVAEVRLWAGAMASVDQIADTVGD